MTNCNDINSFGITWTRTLINNCPHLLIRFNWRKERANRLNDDVTNLEVHCQRCPLCNEENIQTPSSQSIAPHGEEMQFEPLPSACTRAHMWILKWLEPLLLLQPSSAFWVVYVGLPWLAFQCMYNWLLSSSYSPTKYHYGSIDCIGVW